MTPETSRREQARRVRTAANAGLQRFKHELARLRDAMSMRDQQLRKEMNESFFRIGQKFEDIEKARLCELEEENLRCPDSAIVRASIEAGKSNAKCLESRMSVFEHNQEDAMKTSIRDLESRLATKKNNSKKQTNSLKNDLLACKITPCVWRIAWKLLTASLRVDKQYQTTNTRARPRQARV